MIELHPSFLSKGGKKEFAVLPYEEYLALLELLEDTEDLQALRLAKQQEGDKISLTLQEVKELLLSST